MVSQQILYNHGYNTKKYIINTINSSTYQVCGFIYMNDCWKQMMNKTLNQSQLNNLLCNQSSGSSSSLSSSSSTSSSSNVDSLNDLLDVLVEDNSIYVGNNPSSTTDDAKYNTMLGLGTMKAITTGDYNTIIGANSGTILTTGNSNIIIGYNSNTSSNGTNQIIIGNNITGKNNTVVIGDGNITSWIPNSTGQVDLGSTNNKFKDLHLSGTSNSTGHVITSDINLKKNINTLTNCLDKIQYIRGVEFQWKRK